ncbi:MAG: sodium:solute symporter family protein [Verrucomicrobia bacterium]|nr:sodium:solute symporter family protein [Verrucomicrobiota bacterium]
MNSESASSLFQVGNGLWFFFILYSLILLGIGWLGNRASSSEASLSDFYLSARSMSFWVLLPTLYATQYSGNTLVGFAAKAYRGGFSTLVVVTFMMGVVGFYLLYAPRLFALSRRYEFITTADYIQHRFGNRLLSTSVAVSGIVAMANFIISNLKAIGVMTSAATGGQTPAWVGICFFALVILIYETLGGLRSVAWTDVIQGFVLFLGCIAIFAAVIYEAGGVGSVLKDIHQAAPSFWEVPSASQQVEWWSTLMIISIGIALYPHAVQRIYAARSASALKNAFQVMVYLPLFTTLLMLSVGWIGRTRFPALSDGESEGITLKLLTTLATELPSIQWIVFIFLAAVFSAIMSTVDSALLSISSMLTQDLYRVARPKTPESILTRFGTCSSFVVMIICVLFSIFINQSIYKMIEIKLELLAQIAPAVFLGLYWKSLRAGPVLWGFVAGIGISLYFVLGSQILPWAAIPTKPMGIHAGLLALGVNLLLVIGLQLFSSSNKQSHSKKKPFSTSEA